MKQQQQKLHYGNKAIVFTLDIFVALTIFLVAIAISMYYVSQASENKLAQLQMATAASDLLALMDNNETLQTFNSTLIEDQKNQLLTPAYQMRILIQTNNNVTVDTGGTPAQGISTIAGKRYFVTENDTGEARYWIWARQ